VTDSTVETRASRPNPLSSGFVILLPLLVVGLLVEQIFLALHALLLPLLDAMPGVVFQRTAVRLVAVCLTFVVLLYMVGLLARTRMGRALGGWMEPGLQNHVPLYLVLHNLAAGLVERGEEKTMIPAQITVDSPGLTQLGLIVEQHADGSATVFLPGSPNPSSGTVVVVDAERIRELHVPVPSVFKCVGSWGHGTAALLEKSDSAGTGERRQKPDVGIGRA